MFNLSEVFSLLFAFLIIAIFYFALLKTLKRKDKKTKLNFTDRLIHILSFICIPVLIFLAIGGAYLETLPYSYSSDLSGQEVEKRFFLILFTTSYPTISLLASSLERERKVSRLLFYVPISFIIALAFSILAVFIYPTYIFFFLAYFLIFINAAVLLILSMYKLFIKKSYFGGLFYLIVSSLGLVITSLFFKNLWI